MTFDDWVFERQRDYPLNYVLTGSDREFIQNKRKSDHPKDDPRKRIQNKKDKLPNRIRDLLIDIKLLDDDGQLTSVDSNRIFEQLGDISKSTNLDLDFGLGSPYDRNYVVGEKIGRSIHRIQDPTTAEEQMTLVLGFISAFVENGAQDSQPKISFDEFIDFLSEKSKERKKGRDLDNGPDIVYQNHNQHIEAISEILSTYNLTPDQMMSEALWNGIEYSPIEEEEEFCDKLEILLAESPLRQVNELQVAIASDTDNIFNKEISGVDAQEIFETVLKETRAPLTYSSSSCIGRQKVRQKLNQSISQKSCTTAIRHFGGRYERINWPTFPIFSKKERGWTVTAYGSLLAYCKYQKNGSANWLYRPWGFPDHKIPNWSEYVLPALRETGDAHYDTQWICDHNPHAVDE
ncbi:hypothetical protein [Haloarcula marismortui]|uniref:Uncharacterized protein n=1 Tax=Haloarcula marismortui ATCC 33799 TaxID=662475 RepID=M0KS94_9EURY|nr:hypothetical protein [Haloarcula californiae]EMA23803.1 hypothetical protein C435_03653 [Haloarcula californiae ATCC 33799]